MSELVTALHVVVFGRPRGQGRPRIGRGPGGRPIAFKDPADVMYAKQIRDSWREQCHGRLPEGPWEVGVHAYFERPPTHFKKDGSLGAVGLRMPHPTKKPDADNLLKNIDALVFAGAVPDDMKLIAAYVTKDWCGPGDQERVEITAKVYDGCARGAS